jgi:hypothetical protein
MVSVSSKLYCMNTRALLEYAMRLCEVSFRGGDTIAVGWARRCLAGDVEPSSVSVAVNQYSGAAKCLMVVSSIFIDESTPFVRGGIPIKEVMVEYICTLQDELVISAMKSAQLQEIERQSRQLLNCQTEC